MVNLNEMNDVLALINSLKNRYSIHSCKNLYSVKLLSLKFQEKAIKDCPHAS